LNKDPQTSWANALYEGECGGLSWCGPEGGVGWGKGRPEVNDDKRNTGAGAAVIAAAAAAAQH